MKNANIKWIFWVLVLGLFVYEFVTLYFTAAPDDHITAIIAQLSTDPLVPFGFGLLMGHFFWSQKK